MEGCEGLYRKDNAPNENWDGTNGLVARYQKEGMWRQGLFMRAEDIERTLSEIPGLCHISPLKLPLCDACGEPSAGSVIKGDSIFCWACVKL